MSLVYAVGTRGWWEAAQQSLRGRGRMQEENNAGPRFPTVMVWLFHKGFLEAEQKLEEVISKPPCPSVN